MAGDIGCAEHLSTDAAGHLPFMPNHVGAESVFGGEGRGTGLQAHKGTEGHMATRSYDRRASILAPGAA